MINNNNSHFNRIHIYGNWDYSYVTKTQEYEDQWFVLVQQLMQSKRDCEEQKMGENYAHHTNEQ